MAILVFSNNGTFTRKVSLALAVAAADVVGKTIVVTSNQTVDDVTVPVTMTLEIRNSAVITVNSGKTLTINGPFKADLKQCFTGAGSVVFGDNSTAQYQPVWSGGTDLPYNGRKNRLINGGFAINQRAAATNADDTYSHDMWYVLTQTGTVAVTTVSNAEDGTPNMARLTQSQASAQRMGYAQIIESADCINLRGKQVTFKVGRLRASASQPIRMAVLEWTGTANAVTSDVVSDWTSASYTAGGFFINTTTTVSGVVAQTPAAATLTTGTSLTVTLGSTFNNLIVFVWTEGTAAQNFTLDLGKCQLEPGAVATQFEYKQTNTDEFQLCQRYCEVLSGYWAYRASYVTANTFECPLPPFKVVKLVAPVITLKSGVVNTNLSANPVNASGAYTGFTSVTFSRQTVNGAAIILTKSGHGYTDGVIEADQTVSILVEANL